MKMDPKLVASVENSGSELKYIAKRYKVPMKALRAILLEIGQNGKPEHSRKEIYTELEKRGYRVGGVKMVLPEDSEAPVLPESKVYVNG
jgi:hypothetical protein